MAKALSNLAFFQCPLGWDEKTRIQMNLFWTQMNQIKNKNSKAAKLSCHTLQENYLKNLNTFPAWSTNRVKKQSSLDDLMTKAAVFQMRQQEETVYIQE